jgi:5-methylcytosine-specific restriction protein A
MQTFLLTWNPKKWTWSTLDADYDSVHKHGYFDDRWSCGRNKRIRRGDRVFLSRQGQEPRGIIASGFVTSDEPATAAHYTLPGRTALYVGVRFDMLLHVEREPILPRAKLDTGALADVHWDTQVGGITISPDAAAELEELWRAFLTQRGYSPIVLADEIPAAERYWEGALRRITVNAYERDANARRACIAHHGAACSVCGFDFEATYGVLGRGFIHVHHTRPLSGIGAAYAVDPVQDLIPVCPNCHAMLHRTSPPLSLAALSKRLSNATNAA